MYVKFIHPLMDIILEVFMNENSNLLNIDFIKKKLFVKSNMNFYCNKLLPA